MGWPGQQTSAASLPAILRAIVFVKRGLPGYGRVMVRARVMVRVRVRVRFRVRFRLRVRVR